jgi:nucleotide-binding universal stress UspA family protein
MLPFEKILCPTDFSEPSYEALKAAGELAYHFGSELCIIHVVSPVPLMPTGAEPPTFNVILYEEELMASSKRSLEEVLNHLKTKEIKARLIAVRENAADEIFRIADEERADLIVIATSGRTGLDRLLFGSVAEKVVRLAKCPVLTVTGRPSPEGGREIHPEKERTGRTEGGEKLSEVKQDKETYQGKIESQLKEWAHKIDELKAKAEKSKVEVKKKYEKEIEALRNKQETVQRKLKEMKESGEETWEGMKAGVEKGSEELKAALDQNISKFKEMGDDVADSVLKKRKTYQEKVEVQLQEWGIQIDVLKAKAGKSKVEAKEAYLNQIEELKRKLESARQNLHKIKDSGGEAWGEVKAGMDKTLEDLKQTFNRARSKFKEK